MSAAPTSTPSFWKDRLGIAASSLCAVHCLGTAVLLALAPTLRLGIFSDERLEWAAFAVAALIGLFALIPSFRSVHHEKSPLVFFSVGLLIVLAARTMAPEEGPWEVLGAVLGASFMITGHMRNLRCTRHCASC